MSKKDWVVASFSGGKDSTAMVLRMIELGEHIDEVLFCDTYKEFPAMYRHVQKVKEIIEQAGIKFTEIKNPKTFDYLMFNHEVQRKNKKLEGLKGYSWAGTRSRWCTSKLKLDMISNYLKSLHEQFNVIQCVGLAADEEYRLERENNKQDNLRHPLVEWGWDEATCLKYCYSKGFDWEGLYKLFKRVSCWCCPLQSLEELRKLRRNFPDLWKELQDMDSKTWRKFRADFTVQQLEIRFSLEEQMLAEGKSITNRAFHRELKKSLNEGRVMKMNKNMFVSKMKLYGDNQTALAEGIGLSVQRLNAKINETGGAEFTQGEIQRIKERYNLTNDEVNDIFFD